MKSELIRTEIKKIRNGKQLEDCYEAPVNDDGDQPLLWEEFWDYRP